MNFTQEFRVRENEPRYQPVILLLDVSASMRGEPIRALHEAVGVMVEMFAHEMTRENMFKIAIITFGGDGAVIHTPYTDAQELQKQGVPVLKAGGGTLLYEALTLAKDMIEDKEKTSGRWYVPSIVLVSDGRPASGWEKALNSFVQTGRTAKCIRIGVPIGAKADEDMMLRFTGNSSMIFHAKDVNAFSDTFRKVSETISRPRSENKSPSPSTVRRKTVTTVKRPVRHNDDDDEE